MSALDHAAILRRWNNADSGLKPSQALHDIAALAAEIERLREQLRLVGIDWQTAAVEVAGLTDRLAAAEAVCEAHDRYWDCPTSVGAEVGLATLDRWREVAGR